MPMTRTAARRPESVAVSRAGRAFMSFCIFGKHPQPCACHKHEVLTHHVGAASVIVPSIVYSAGYLIIPYSRPVVLLLETLPALITQLTLPYALPYVPWTVRPCFIAVSWVCAAAISLATPPNVPPPLRVFTAMLMSITTAATDLSFVPLMRYHGQAAVGGWALGTGLGNAVAVAIPLMSHLKGVFVRRSLWYIFYLTMAMLGAYFVVLPGVPLPRTRRDWFAKPNDSGEREEAESLLEYDEGHRSGESLKASMRRNLAVVRPLIRSSALPMVMAFTVDAFLFPASLRAQPRQSNPGKLFKYQATFGLVYELGSLLGSISVMLVRSKNLRQMTMLLGAGGGALFLNELLALISAPFIVLTFAFFAGVGVGAIYLHILGILLDKQIGAPVSDCDFAVSVLLCAETAGKLIGSVSGYTMEALICSSGFAAQRRWCSCTR